MPTFNSPQRKDDNPQQDRSKDKIANAFPLTVGFLLLVVIVLYGQEFLSERKPPANTIILAYDQAEQTVESEEDASIDSLEQIDLKKAELIIDSFIANEIKSQNLIEQINQLNESTESRDKTFNFVVQSIVARKDYQKVLNLLEKLSAKQRTSNKLEFTYALLLSKTDRNKEATIQFQNILKKQPNHQASIVNLGLLYLQQKLYQQAADLFDNGLGFASGSHKAKMYAGYGDAKLALGFKKEAIKAYKKSIEYRPTHSLTWRKLARAEKASNEPINIVILSYQKALALSPKNNSLHTEFANYLFSKMKYSLVTKLLRKSLIQSKASINERLLLVVSYTERNRSANARKQLNYLKTHTTRKFHKAQVKGLELFLKRNYEDAIVTLKDTLKKNRDNTLAYYFIGRSYQKLKKPKNALVYLNKIQPASLYYNTSQFRAGLAYIESGDTAKAELVFNQLFTRLPQNDEIAFSVAKLAYAKKNYSVAYSAMSRAILTSPDKKQYRFMEAKIRWRMGERDKVIQLLNDILSRSPNYKAAIYRLADYLYQLQRIEESLEYFNRLLELDADYSNTQLRIARIYFSKDETKQLAIPLIESYLERKGSDVKARVFYARVLCGLDETKKCRQQLQLVEKFSPNNKEVDSIENIYF